MDSAALQKHRDEREVYEIDFASRLAAGETLANPQVKVTREADGGWTDDTSTFVTGTPAVAGSVVQFTLKAAGTGEQPVGAGYLIYAKVDTSAGRILVATAELSVVGEGSG